jgi:hypothetical protein
VGILAGRRAAGRTVRDEEITMSPKPKSAGWVIFVELPAILLGSLLGFLVGYAVANLVPGFLLLGPGLDAIPLYVCCWCTTLFVCTVGGGFATYRFLRRLRTKRF